MATFFLTVFVFALVMVAMAVGVLRGRPPLKGSCGGLAAAGIDEPCEICGGNPAKCDAATSDAERKVSARAAPFYDADH